MHGVGEGVKATLSNQVHHAAEVPLNWTAQAVPHATAETIGQSLGVHGTYAAESFGVEKAGNWAASGIAENLTGLSLYFCLITRA